MVLENSYSLLLIDSSDVARLGCKAVFETDHRFQIIGDLRHADALTNAVAEQQPDLVILDPLVDGDLDAGLAQKVMVAFPNAACLLFTDYADSAFVVEAFYWGVRGYVIKNRAPADLLLAGAYAVASRTGLLVDRLLFEKVIQDRTSKQGTRLPEASAVSLTLREREILNLLARGLSDDQVAHELGVARTTIHSHVSTIFHKLPVSNRVQLGIYAAQAGLI